MVWSKSYNEFYNFFIFYKNVKNLWYNNNYLFMEELNIEKIVKDLLNKMNEDTASNIENIKGVFKSIKILWVLLIILKFM